MTDEPLETSELQAFLAVADQGSVARAAEALGLPRATVSRRLGRLEERLGVRLFRRTTRRVAITEAGRELDPHARRILDAVREASDRLSSADGEPRGLLRVSVPPGPAAILEQLVLSFMDRYPAVRIEVERSSRQVDLAGGAFDVAIRASTRLDPGLVARRLASVELGVVASPAYLARAGRPTSAGDLTRHACLVGYERGERPATSWPLVGGGAAPVRARLASNDMLLLTGAAERGEGLALLPDSFVAERVASGRLVRVLEGVVASSSSIAVVFAERGLLAPAVRAFIDHAVGSAAGLAGRPAEADSAEE